MWWIYFAYPQGDRLVSQRLAILWGYGHVFIFGAAAVYSAGVQVSIDYINNSTDLGEKATALAMCVPITIFVFVSWILLMRGQCSSHVNRAMAIAPILILGAAFLPGALQLAGLVMLGLVVAISLEPGAQREKPEPVHP